ncbi:GNAT family N-acetyltransferase [Clostridium frigidicarnis]|uniref:N-acetyltransferase domain-containing protein n=1 Tax=Clostridium frigidicarnis TaxID=84698 RepID=A0A1I1AWI0_9CLOT|nr:GNAT family N-acetyltransferase [Clostridium frigidicarnis]SFB42411.1 hypothetical protein SAMN04488528_105020 [Clostridium frigidicarnis]
MYIREFNKDDTLHIKDLLIEIYHDDVCSIGYFKFGNSTSTVKTLVAINRNKIIGVASLWENKIHKDSIYIGIHLLEKFRHKGLGTSLFSQLLEFNHKKQYQCSLWSYNNIGLKFAKKLDFNVMRKTFEPIYDLSLIPKINLLNDLDFCYSINSFASLNNTKFKKSNIISLFKEIYMRNHKFNKVSKLSDSQWDNIIFNNLCPDASFAILKDSKIIALSLMYYGEDNLTLELGLRGVKGEFLFFENNLILTLLDSQFTKCKKENYLFIKDEIDSTDSGAMVVSQLIDLTKISSWNTLIR